MTQCFTKELIFAEAYFLGLRSPAQFLGWICGGGFGRRRGTDYVAICVAKAAPRCRRMPVRLRRSHYRNETRWWARQGLNL
jgi:hypothetical protein